MTKNFQTLLSVLIIFFLCAITLAVFLQVRHFDFLNYDDPAYVTANPYILRGFSPEGLQWVWTSVVCANWHPLTMLTHMMDVRLYGLWAGGHHLSNVFFHLLNAILLFLALYKMTGGLWKSAFVAAIFAIPPLHVESGAWISERKDVLSGMFFMLTLLAYTKYVKAVGAGFKPAPTAFYFLTIIFFALGLMSKSMLVTVPCVLLLLDYWPFRRIESKAVIPRLVFEKISFFVLSFIASIAALHTQQGALARLDYLPFKLRLANALVSYIRYLEKIFWPKELVVVYSHPGADLSFALVLLSVFLLALISFYAFYNAKRHPYFVVGWLWFLGTLVPVIGLIQVGTQAMADRYSYIPMIGFLIAMIWTVDALLMNWQFGRKILSIAGIAIIGLLIPVSHRQVSYWRSSADVFSHAAKATPNNVNAFHGLAMALDAKGDFEGAKRYLFQALGVNPRFAPAGLSLAGLFAKQGKMEEAIRYLQNTFEVDPHNEKAQFNLGSLYYQQKKYKEALFYYSKILEDLPNDARAHFYVGSVLEDQGKTEAALEHFKKSLAGSPDYPLSNYHLALILARQEQWGKAIPHFLKAIKTDLLQEDAGHDFKVGGILNFTERYAIYPEAAEVESALADTYRRMGNLKEAASHFLKAIEKNPDYAPAHYGLGSVFAAQGETELALEQFQSALKLKPDYFEVYSDLAILLKRKGKLDEAIHFYKKALAIKPDDPNIHYNLANAFVTKGDLGNAEEHYLKTLGLKSDFIEAFNNLGSLYKKENKLEEARSQYEKALSVNPNYIEARFNLGELYQRQGKKSLAAKEYQRILTLNPAYIPALKKMKELEGL